MRLFTLITVAGLLLGCGSSSSVKYADPEAPPPAPAPAPGAEVVVGQSAPGFELPDEAGELQSLADLNAGRYVALVFNRGHW